MLVEPFRDFFIVTLYSYIGVSVTSVRVFLPGMVRLCPLVGVSIIPVGVFPPGMVHLCPLVWGFRSEYAFKFLLCAAPKKEGFLSRRLERPADGPTDRPTDLDPTREAATNVMLRERS